MRITLESRKQRAFDMAQILTDRHAPITSQTNYPLRHAASKIQWNTI